MALANHLDFEVVKEPWNRYELADGSILKTKLVLTKVTKDEQDTRVNAYSFDFQNIAVVLTGERGPPSSKSYSQDEIRAATVKEIQYQTLSEESNEYSVNDGGRIRIKSSVYRVTKTSLFDKSGKPIYWIDFNQIPQIKRPPIAETLQSPVPRTVEVQN